MLPHLRRRPVNTQPFLTGSRAPSLFKKVPGHFPDFVSNVEVVTANGTQQQVVLNDKRTPVDLRGQACLTPAHLAQRSDDLDRPEQLIFDLDFSCRVCRR